MVCAALAAAALVAGCGSDEETAGTGTEPPATRTAAAPATAGTTTDTIGEAPSGTGRVAATAPKRRRLREEGFDVSQSRVSGGGPDLEAALELPLDGGGAMTVFAYGTRAGAEKKADEFRPTAKKYPDYFRVVVRGTTVYLGVAEDPEKLSRRSFDRAVAVAEGR